MKRYLFPILFVALTFNLYGQANPDSLLTESIKKSKLKNFSGAEQDAMKALSLDSSRVDLMIHLANLYAWQHSFKEAHQLIEKAYNLDKQSSDLYSSWLNILLWNNEYEEIHRVAELAVSAGYKDTTNLALKRLIAYKQTYDYKSALKFAESLDGKTLNQPSVKAVYDEIYVLSPENQLSVSWSADFFINSSNSSQHLAYLEYNRRIRQNNLIFRLNIAKRFGKYDLQPELDYYLKFRDGKYLYLNYGLGMFKKLFPGHRAGIEYYQSVGHGNEVSLGSRLLVYGNQPVWIATGSLGKYIGNSWISFRSFYVFGKNNALTVNANYRYFMKNPTNFLGAELGYGNSPDERNIITDTGELLRLQAFRTKFIANFLLSPRNEIRINLGFSNEETILGNYIYRLSTETVFRHRF